MVARVVLKNILTSNVFFYTNIIVLWNVNCECLLCKWSVWCARTKRLVKCIQKLKFPCITTLILGQQNDKDIKNFCHLSMGLEACLASCYVTASESTYKTLWQTGPIFRTFFPMMAEIFNLRNPPMKLTTLSNYWDNIQVKRDRKTIAAFLMYIKQDMWYDHIKFCFFFSQQILILHGLQYLKWTAAFLKLVRGHVTMPLQ